MKKIVVVVLCVKTIFNFGIQKNSGLITKSIFLSRPESVIEFFHFNNKRSAKSVSSNDIIIIICFKYILLFYIIGLDSD